MRPLPPLSVSAPFYGYLNLWLHGSKKVETDVKVTDAFFSEKFLRTVSTENNPSGFNIALSSDSVPLRTEYFLSLLGLTINSFPYARRGNFMVSALDSGSSGPGSSPGRGHCVVFLGKTLYSHGTSLHPGV